MKVDVEQRGHVLLIGINRPEKRNAFDLRTHRPVRCRLRAPRHRSELRVGVVHAVGDHFSAGLDLAEVGGEGRRGRTGALAGEYQFDPSGWGAAGAPSLRSWRCRGSPLHPEHRTGPGQRYSWSRPTTCASGNWRSVAAFCRSGGATLRATAQLGWGNAMRFLLTADEFEPRTPTASGWCRRWSRRDSSSIGRWR